MENKQEPIAKKDNSSLKKGCGCFLLAVGCVIAAIALLTVIFSVIGEKQGYDSNEAAWEEYNANLPVIDSLYEAGVPDSIIEQNYPQPMIRQGGFAVIFGGVMALLLFAVAAIPIIIGVVLLRKHKRRNT